MNDYDKWDITTRQEKLQEEISRVNSEIAAKKQAEFEFKNKKTELIEKYNNSEIQSCIQRILENKNTPEELIKTFDEIIGENPSLETCEYLEKCINAIDPLTFNKGRFISEFKQNLKAANLSTCKISSDWRNDVDNNP